MLLSAPLARLNCRSAAFAVQQALARRAKDRHISRPPTFSRGLMLYDAYEVQRSFLAGASKLAGMGAGWLNNPSNPWGYSSMGPTVAATLEVFAHAAAPRGKPEFGIHSAKVGRTQIAVGEEILLRKPFGQLKHFARHGIESGPRLLIVAPMSGHYATLLR